MRIDPQPMAEVRGRLSASADALVHGGAALSAPSFGGPQAGRDHRAQGEAVRAGLCRLADSLDSWAEATRAAADALARTCAAFEAAEDTNRVNLAGR
ncbi:hypothetical protein [Speluncibacter jeojiensis]|uniref:ESX-1 secretion-associated protein n=1 Tax=Speluncibacter jeojiensis TaxID=2710754 RepID=A0A9X4RE48_9ACTN|nr:hypothetical protein [Corynebacteriales bacterium D3-21]